MKKKIAMLLTAAMIVGSFAGCGEKTENNSTVEESGAATENNETGENNTDATANNAPKVTLKDFEVEKYVTLGEYKGLEVTVSKLSVDTSMQEQYVKSLFNNNITEAVGVKDRAVENGDLVYISYVGKRDGVAFDGGTTDGTFLEIGSGSYIDGFEEGLIGVMPGETVDLNLTFPEVYENNPDLAGAPVVFTTTVIYIAPEMTDEVVAAMGNENFSSVQEMNDYVYATLEENAKAQYDLSLENEVIEALLANTTFAELPQDLLDKYSANIISNMTTAAATYGYDVDSYAMMLYGVDAYSAAAQFGEDSAKQGLVFQVIADKENLNVTDEELDKNLQQYVADYGLSSVEELLGDTDKEDYRDFFMFEKVIAFLIDNAVVNEQ